MKKTIGLGCLFMAITSQYTLAQVPALAKSWTGLYNDEQKIALFLTQNSTKLTGYSILNGKKINFTGSINSKGKITLKEQGSGANVGVFEFQYQPKTNVMEGSWVSSSSQIKPKFFNLSAQQCKYAKNAGNFPQSSQRLLKDADLQLSLDELQYMRNETYARHGYAFANRDWAATFAAEDWYMPCYTNVEDRLTIIEKQNIKRIKMVEPYAEKLDWGR